MKLSYVIVFSHTYGISTYCSTCYKIYTIKLDFFYYYHLILLFQISSIKIPPSQNYNK